MSVMIPGSEKWTWRFSRYLVLLALLLMVCHVYDPLKELKQGDFDIVEPGKYHGTTIFLRAGTPYKDVADILRHEIEQNRDLLPIITRKHYDVQERLVYEFKFAALDSIRDTLILRYFARIYDHQILAGYQIQFVFKAGSRELVSIFTAEVGLE